MALTEETKAEAENHPQKRIRTVFAVRLCIWGRGWEIVMTTSDGAPLQNALLPQAKAPWRTFSAGALLQVILLFVAFSVPLLFPDRVKDLRRYAATESRPLRMSSGLGSRGLPGRTRFSLSKPNIIQICP